MGASTFSSAELAVKYQLTGSVMLLLMPAEVLNSPHGGITLKFQP